ncbi:MAG: 3-oxoacyl-[acyl-carrier-protein] reductase [Bacteroidales bacterium]|nr:3-oxoacyl-[acyl-carrier-protein] reductase [Bacteroidales bacterium]
MELLKGKVALVTGATRGIGRQIALTLASEGADIAFISRSENDNFKSLIGQVEALGVRCCGYAVEGSDFNAAHEVVSKVVSYFGRLDILVNNAGITKDGLMLRMSEQQWDEVINVNLKSAFNYTHAAVPVMAKQRSGSIINISSIVGLSGNAGQCNYSASKAGMIALAKSIAKEMGSRGIRANAVAPGFVETEMTAALPEETRTQWCKGIALRRGATAAEVANVVLFLSSDLSSYVTGQVIVVDGGMS